MYCPYKMEQFTHERLFFCLLILATRERVHVFFQTDLICCVIFFQLVSDILCYDSLVFPNRIYIISSAPKMSVSVFVFQICVPIKYHE